VDNRHTWHSLPLQVGRKANSQGWAGKLKLRETSPIDGELSSGKGDDNDDQAGYKYKGGAKRHRCSSRPPIALQGLAAQRRQPF
ncbi:hypothetical protein FRC18_009056, partial [Serendipita sp. 400]